jgi:hypothetical protein
MDERYEGLVAGSRNRESEVTMTTAIIGVGITSRVELA